MRNSALMPGCTSMPSVGPEPGLDDGVGVRRHDLEQALSLADHAADGVDREAEYRPADGSTNDSTVKDVLGDALAFLGVGQFVARVLELLSHLKPVVALNLVDLPFELRDLIFESRDMAHEFLLLALEGCRRALELQNRRVRRVALVVKHLLRTELFLDHIVLALRGLGLALVDRGLALRLLDLLLDRGDLRCDGGAPGIEELLLRFE